MERVKFEFEQRVKDHLAADYEEPEEQNAVPAINLAQDAVTHLAELLAAVEGEPPEKFFTPARLVRGVLMAAMSIWGGREDPLSNSDAQDAVDDLILRF